MTATYWNGEPCRARRVVVRVGAAPVPSWWCAALIGEERQAVEVRYGPAGPFFLDDEDGSGWWKVTAGHGSPRWSSRSLPLSCEVLREAAP